MNKPKIDAHCHLFNKDILTLRIWLEIIHGLEGIVKPKAKLSEQPLDDKISELEGKIRGIINFIRIGWSKSSTDIYELLQKEYVDSQNENFIVTPLMLDIKFAFAEPHQSFRPALTKHRDEDDEIKDAIKDLTDQLEQHVMDLGDEARKKYFGKNLQLFNSAEREKHQNLSTNLDQLFDTHAELKKLIEEIIAPANDIAKMKQILKREGSYEIQISQMIDLLQHPDYGQYVIPFFSVDPRRADTPQNAAEYLAEIKKSVGKGKTFAGIKLYCPLGYSPTSPFLYGSKNGDGSEDCLYKYCQDNKIPITAHCSDAGFATFAREAIVTGHILTKVDGVVGEEVVYVENKLIDFGTTVLRAPDKQEAIRVRARMLNHPKIWENVYKRYETIYLNLAHFGGEDVDGDWRPTIDTFIKTYTNAYTDFSCYSDTGRLEDVKKQYYDCDGAPKNKFMYGSDYYLVMLYQLKFSDYIAKFVKLFTPDEFVAISEDNPRAFMGNVTDQ